jgi:hypothetical protein
VTETERRFGRYVLRYVVTRREPGPVFVRMLTTESRAEADACAASCPGSWVYDRLAQLPGGGA